MSETVKKFLAAALPMTSPRQELVVIPQPGDKVAQLTATIQRNHEEAEAAGQTAVLKSIATGKALAELKRSVTHGQFERYVAANFTFAMGTAQKYMRFARRESQILQHIERLRSVGLHLSMPEALKFLNKLTAEEKPKPIKRKQN